MKNETVRDWMSSKPIVCHKDTTLPDAHAMMKEYNIRRMPVVDQEQKLLGIVSLTDVREAEPSGATTLSIYELNYLLAKLTVEKIMSKKVVTVRPEDSIAAAAQLMLDRKIGGIPVVDDHQHVVGIITESDIFRMVVKQYMA